MPSFPLAAAARRSLAPGSDLAAMLASGVVRLGAIGMNATQAFVLPMLLGPVAFGLFSSLFTVLLVASGVIREPLEILVQRGRLRDEEGRGELRLAYERGQFRRAILFALLLGSVLFGLLLYSQDERGSTGFAVGLWAATLIAGLSGLRRGEHLVHGRTAWTEQLDAIGRPVLFLMLVAAAALFGIEDQWWAAALVASYLILLPLPNLAATRRMVRGAVGKEKALRPWRDLTLSNGLSLAVKHAGVLVIGASFSLETVGRYFIVARIADIIAFGYSFAAARFVHRFAGQWRGGDVAAARATARRASLFGFGISAVAATGAVLLAPFVFPLIDPGLTDFLPILWVLAGTAVINSTIGVAGAFLVSIDPRHMLTIKFIANPIALVAMLLVVPRFGPMGAALVSLGFALSLQLASLLFFSRLMRRAQEAGR